MIEGEKIEAGEKAPFKGMLLNPPSWILLKSHLDSDRCERAVDSCASSCEQEIRFILDSCAYKGAPENDLLLDSLKFELKQEQEINIALEKKNDLFFILGVSTSLLAVVSTSVLIYTTLY
jgi:hypothetical protein